MHDILVRILSAVVVGALIVLWSFYFFRFAESNPEREVFNRPLADKIGDVQSPAYRFVLTEMASSHVVPRAYVWASPIPSGLVLRGARSPLPLSVARISRADQYISFLV